MSLGGAVLHHGCLVKEAAGLCQPPAPCPCPSFRFRAFIRPKEGIPLAWDIQGTRKAPFENEGGFLASCRRHRAMLLFLSPWGIFPASSCALAPHNNKRHRRSAAFLFLCILCHCVVLFVTLSGQRIRHLLNKSHLTFSSHFCVESHRCHDRYLLHYQHLHY